MKVRELKEILNRTNAHDDLDIYASPLVEIEDHDAEDPTSTKALVPELLERYRILKIMHFSQHIESAPDEAMIIGYDDSENCIETIPSQVETDEFLN